MGKLYTEGETSGSPQNDMLKEKPTSDESHGKDCSQKKYAKPAQISTLSGADPNSRNSLSATTSTAAWFGFKNESATKWVRKTEVNELNELVESNTNSYKRWQAKSPQYDLLQFNKRQFCFSFLS
ncbi:hypothetical protein KIN20_035863 [Parelaphostrongylus tenuis]|uniref:Uncharacterized protein n=1 Tax=Parelaphostrongylus tenuis TaxID=148309 RepID=A0AAD5WK99_PARTN|nr:hypothetical protein KIN20_035863 [Parelaphostrongylus tenuis]